MIRIAEEIGGGTTDEIQKTVIAQWVYMAISLTSGTLSTIAVRFSVVPLLAESVTDLIRHMMDTFLQLAVKATDQSHAEVLVQLRMLAEHRYVDALIDDLFEQRRLTERLTEFVAQYNPASKEESMGLQQAYEQITSYAGSGCSCIPGYETLIRAMQTRPEALQAVANAEIILGADSEDGGGSDKGPTLPEKVPDDVVGQLTGIIVLTKQICLLFDATNEHLRKLFSQRG